VLWRHDEVAVVENTERASMPGLQEEGAIPRKLLSKVTFDK